MFCLRNTELAEKVKQLLLLKLKKQPTTNSVLGTFRKYLVDCYIETPHPSHTQWPFPGTSAYVDLTLLEVPENLQRIELDQQKSLPSPQAVQLSEVFNSGWWKAKRKVILHCHISLQDPAFHSAKFLADIIPHPSSEMREAVARAIADQHGRGVCFLFDS